MIELFLSITATHWLILGLVLLTLELLGSGGYLLWIGGSALAVSVVARLSDLSPEMQWVLFGAISVIFTLAWYFYQRDKDRHAIESSVMNQRAKSLIGERGMAMTDITRSGGRVKVGDGSWLASSLEGTTLPANCTVKVVSIEGTMLLVEKAD